MTSSRWRRVRSPTLWDGLTAREGTMLSVSAKARMSSADAATAPSAIDAGAAGGAAPATGVGVAGGALAGSSAFFFLYAASRHLRSLGRQPWITRFRLPLDAAWCSGHSLRRWPLPSTSCLRQPSCTQIARCPGIVHGGLTLRPIGIVRERTTEHGEVVVKVSTGRTLRPQFLRRQRKRRFRGLARLNEARPFPSNNARTCASTCTTHSHLEYLECLRPSRTRGPKSRLTKFFCPNLQIRCLHEIN